MKNAETKKTDCKALSKPLKDRMMRAPVEHRAATAREILGRNPRAQVVAGYTGLIRLK